MTTALVTGGAGFIGSHLCERLAAAGFKVISLDNYFTGKKGNHVAGVVYREGHTKDIAALVPETPDIIFHLGEYSRTAVAMDEPGIVLDLNLVGTSAVLEFWRQKKSKLIYAGSSTKFADAREDGVAGRDLSPYTSAKAAMSELVSNYGRWYGLPFAVSYFFNVYGPRELSGKYGTVIEIFKEQLLEGKPLTMRLPGTQTRNYTHVLDTVDALMLIAEKGEGEEFGIASAKSYTTREVAGLFGGPIEELSARHTSRPSTPVDTTNLQQLGWEEQHSLEEYVRSIKESSQNI